MSVMRKTAALAVSSLVILFGCTGLESNAEEPERSPDDVHVIEYIVGANRIVDPNKEAKPISEFEWGIPFEVKVTLEDPELSLSLSNFRVVKFNPDWQTNPPSWVPSDEELLVNGKEGAEMLLSSSRSSLEVVLTKTEGPPDGLHRLVLFDLAVMRGERILFTFDPPWVGRPPTR